MRAKHYFGRASELAFDLLFALFPLILFMLTLFGLFASQSAELQKDFLSYFADVLPRAAFELLRQTTIELAENAGGGKLTFGIVAALWFAAGGIASMISGLNLAYGVRETRSWFRVRILSVALTFGLAICMLVALVGVLVSGKFLDWFGLKIGLEPMVLAAWHVVQWPAAIFFVLIAFSLIYYTGPNLEQRRWHWVTPGSVVGAAAWLLASFGFRLYLHYFNNYSASYGSLGAVMILLAWLYVAGLAFLVGGEINAQIERAMAGGGEQ